MTTTVVKTLKYIGLISVVFITSLSCEKEIESIGVNLVDNNTFSTGKYISDVIASTENIEKVPANGVAQYLLGSYSDPEFGRLNGSIVGQISLPLVGSNYDYGTNAVVDSVLLTIPYQATKGDNFADGKPQFTLDSILGDTDLEFQLEVYELKTFLNSLDPNDPSKTAVYYSDKEFQKGDSPFFSGGFKVNPNDTVAYINRYLADGITVYDKDTIKEADLGPTIKIPLDKDLVTQQFVDNASSGNFDSFEAFSHYFRGFYIEAMDQLNQDSHLISLDMDGANMTIYYSKDENEDADQDLNGNGTNGETGVRTKHEYKFVFGLLKSNVLERDYSNSKQSGPERLYLQGAAGSMATIEIFSNDDLQELRGKNWLINNAQLVFYPDPNAASSIYPEQLFLYNYDKKIQIIDMLSEGLQTVGGALELDEDGNPERYVIRITDYISDVLNYDDPSDLVKFGIRVYNPSDSPSGITDTKIRDYNWNPKGVVLFNHHPSAGDKRVTLEIHYTELQN